MDIPPLRKWAMDKFGNDTVISRVQDIIAGTRIENIETNKTKMAVNTTQVRLKKLLNLDLNIEYLILGGQLIEYKLKRIISAYKFTLNNSLILQDFNTTLKIDIQHEKTLGQLIKQFGSGPGFETVISFNL